MRVIRKGSGKPVVGVVGCLHGDERIGKKIIDWLDKVSLAKGSLVLVLANEEAIALGRRYVDADLNRCFPGKSNGSHEEKIAAKMLQELKECDVVIDIHSTSAVTENFVVVTKHPELVGKVPLEKVVWMGDFGKGKALIDFVNGVSIEFDVRTGFQNVVDTISVCLCNLGLLEGKVILKKQEHFVVYDVMKKDSSFVLKNFEKTVIKNENFYPVLFGEKAYTEILCLKTRKK